jgi:hypothetical protein
VEQDSSLEIILLGGLAMQHYGLGERSTIDIDAEVKGPVEALALFLRGKGVPADLGEDISRWSIVSLPPGFRERSTSIYKEDLLHIKVLSPVDFIIAKLRRSTDEDIADALFVAHAFHVSGQEVNEAKKEAMAHSPKDTQLWHFNRSVECFVRRLKST